MAGAKAPVMAGIHGLEQVYGLLAPDLPDHYTVRSHTQSRPYQHPDPDGSLALPVGVSCFQPYQVLNVGQLQFR